MGNTDYSDYYNTKVKLLVAGQGFTDHRSVPNSLEISATLSGETATHLNLADVDVINHAVSHSKSPQFFFKAVINKDYVIGVFEE